MNRMTKLLLAGTLAFGLVASIGAAGMAVTTASAQQAPTATPGTNLSQTFWQALATRLGVSLDKLTQAVKDAGKDTTAAQVQAGQITQAQADAANAQIDQWQPGQGGPFDLPFGHGFGRGFGHGGGAFGGSVGLDAAAKALGMTTADLTTQLQSGKTLAALAQAKNVDPNTVKQAMVDAAKAQVDAAVTAGRITADQATQMKAQIDQEAARLDLSQPFRLGRPNDNDADDGVISPTPAQPTTPTTPTTPSSTF